MNLKKIINLMRFIDKRREPKVLSEYKAKGGTRYDGGSLKKNEIQEQLLNEQKGLCAYCMKRISAPLNKTPHLNIEHILCRTHYPNKELDYLNMVGVCLGNSDKKNAELHCDKSKDSSKHHYLLKKLIPTTEDVESFFKFTKNGKMIPVSEDIDIQRDIQRDIDALNLNEFYTKKNRENIIIKLENDYKRKCKSKNKGEVYKFLRKELLKWNTLNENGFLQPYCIVAIKFISKKLRQI
ncbi:MAG: retron system putative HNH endonuclease [Bacteroidales bacterium]